jgi:uncharacterized lipoprotein
MNALLPAGPALGALALLVLSGCAGVQRDTYIRERAGEYVYEKPAAEVIQGAAAMLKEQGYTVRIDPSGLLLMTEWKEEMGASQIASSFSQYMVRGLALDASNSRVQFYRINRSTSGGPNMESTSARNASMVQQGAHSMERSAQQGGARDLAAEFMLMQRLAPEDAKDLEAEATERFK